MSSSSALDRQRGLIDGIALTLVVLAVMPALDLVVAGLGLLAAWLGLTSVAAPWRLAVIGGLLVALAVAAKLALVATLVRQPHRLAWLTRSWGLPIAAVAVGVAAVPLHTAISVGHAVLDARVREQLLDHGDLRGRTLGDVIATGLRIRYGVMFAGMLATTAMWGVAVLTMVARVRRAARSS